MAQPFCFDKNTSNIYMDPPSNEPFRTPVVQQATNRGMTSENFPMVFSEKV